MKRKSSVFPGNKKKILFKTRLFLEKNKNRCASGMKAYLTPPTSKQHRLSQDLAPVPPTPHLPLPETPTLSVFKSTPFLPFQPTRNNLINKKTIDIHTRKQLHLSPLEHTRQSHIYHTASAYPYIKHIHYLNSIYWYQEAALVGAPMGEGRVWKQKNFFFCESMYLNQYLKKKKKRTREQKISDVIATQNKSCSKSGKTKRSVEHSFTPNPATSQSSMPNTSENTSY